MEVTQYSFATNYLGPRTPIAWDGANQHLYVSDTNNARFFAVHSVPGAAPTVTSGTGFKLTTTSNQDYPESAEFVRPGLVPMKTYVDAATNKYNTSVLQVSGTTITELSRVAHPSQDFASSGFVRGYAMFPDQPTFFAYGYVNATSTIYVWQYTVDAAGGISAPVSLGAATTALPSGYRSSWANTDQIAISDRLGIYAFGGVVKGIVDRLNPTYIADGATIIPATAGTSEGQDQVYANARINPGHLYMSRKSSSTNPTVHKVVDIEFNAAGTSASVAGEWTVPSGWDYAYPVVLANGTVAVILLEFTTSAQAAYYDVFGDVDTIDATLGTGYPHPTTSNYTQAGWLMDTNVSLTGTLTQVDPNLPILTIAGQQDLTRVRPYYRSFD